MTLTIRPFTPADLPATAALWHDGWHDAHAAICPASLTRLRTVESFADRLARHAATTRVARLDGRIAGFFTLKDDELYQFFVAAPARGSGLAAALMQAAEDALRDTGLTRAWLACTVGNTRAARFYEKSGWTRATTEPFTTETSDGPYTLDVWRYEKAL